MIHKKTTTSKGGGFSGGRMLYHLTMGFLSLNLRGDAGGTEQQVCAAHFFKFHHLT
jgi:hypothetical protein